uniref:Uncharacterized protein n=1 Tax=Anguilla anguilla TaxID=7936 RepID=A0A0E9SZQ5_ANGAN
MMFTGGNFFPRDYKTDFNYTMSTPSGKFSVLQQVNDKCLSWLTSFPIPFKLNNYTY